MQLAIIAAVAATLTQTANPCADCGPAVGSCVVDDDGTATCYLHCKKSCGEVVRHGWSGYDDGDNACNMCKCSDGNLACTNLKCVDVPCPAEVCKDATKCGGITGARCLSREHVCLDDPADGCNPDEGDADCAGCCVLDQCFQKECKDGYVCELNWFGQAECVHPCSKIECKEGSTCQLNADGEPVCYESCKKTCGDLVPHGWGGFDDGSNACNKCGCADGSMVCTKVACPDVPCKRA
ncbi:hypothetical protein DIPPA_15550 [Diplonema papillatum]|nr:hypothetical protein DIPPA_15550 [Diplonema papillatum]